MGEGVAPSGVTDEGKFSRILATILAPTCAAAMLVSTGYYNRVFSWGRRILQ